MYRKLAMLAVLVSVLSAVIFSPTSFSETAGTASVDNQSIIQFTSKDELLQTLKQYESDQPRASGSTVTTAATESQNRAISDTAKSSADFSGTNVQEQSVDEPDTVKTDGEYIYHISGRELIVAKAYPADSFTVVSRSKFDDNFQPRDMYVDGKTITVLGYKHMPLQTNDTARHQLIDRAYPTNALTSVVMYDASNKQHLNISRTIELQGMYLSSRKIGHMLYLAASQYVSVNADPKADLLEQQYMPMYRDSKKSQELLPLETKHIYHFQDESSNQYLNLGAVQLNNPASSFTVSSYLGGGEQLYMTDTNLYVSKTSRPPRQFNPDTWHADTTIYQFAVRLTGLKYKQKTQIPGTLLNQFSMDEYNGFLRVATTRNNFRAQSDNNLYVLDANLSVKGQIEGLAKGERIYSVRFMGDRGYVVTFKNMDPLYTIDLKNPAVPMLTGELKIPGFSNYLHPYDANHIIGFGRDTEEKTLPDGRSTVIQKGIKLSMFDVSDMEHPKEMFTSVLGDSSVQSELQYNHKALLFSKEKNLFAFPVTQYKEQQSVAGFYVYGFDFKNGFVQRGSISQESDPHTGSKSSRMLYISDTLYLISEANYKFYDATTLLPVRNPYTLQ